MIITIEETDPLYEQVAECKVGDTYQFTGKMTNEAPPEFEITKAEYTEAEPEAEEESEGEEAVPATPMKKMHGNPAIALILGGGKN